MREARYLGIRVAAVIGVIPAVAGVFDFLYSQSSPKDCQTEKQMVCESVNDCHPIPAHDMVSPLFTGSSFTWVERSFRLC